MPAALAVLSSLLWGVADFVGGTVTKRANAFAVVGCSMSIGFVVVTGIALATGSWHGSAAYVPWGIAAGVVGIASLGLFYEALATGTMGVVAPIAATGILVPVAVGLAKGDRPSWIQVLGIAAAFLGCVLAGGPEVRAGAGSARSIVFAGVSAVGFGLALVFLALGAETNVLMTIVTQRTTNAVVAAGLLIVFRSFGGLRAKDAPTLAFVGIGDASANLVFAYASTLGLLSLVSVLGSLYPVATVLLARWVHAERMSRVQNLGVVSALVGVVLIAGG